jgi:hypothetical protein
MLFLKGFRAGSGFVRASRRKAKLTISSFLSRQWVDSAAILDQVRAQGFHAKVSNYDFPAVGWWLLQVPLVGRKPDKDERITPEWGTAAPSEAIQTDAEFSQ